MLEGSCEGHYIVVEDMVLPEGTLIHDYTLDAKEQPQAEPTTQPAQQTTTASAGEETTASKEERFRNRMDRFLKMDSIVQ